jgi:two-component system sensor kinase FixL
MAIAEVNADIGALRRAEDTLLRLAAIVASSHDAIIAKTTDGVVTDWNAAAETMFGYTGAEIIGQPIVVLFPQERLTEEAAILDRIRGGENVETFETVRRREDGRLIPVAVTISPILDTSGAIVGASKIVRDLSERQDRERRLNELQEELVHLSRLTELGLMVSALAHEVNQPLTAMSNYLRAVRRLIAAGNQQGALQAVDRIEDQGDRARQIIRRLRDQVTKRETERRVESLSKTIEEASSLALLGIGQGLKLDIRVNNDADEAVIDKVQIQQVLLNLVRNAAEAMDGSAQRELSIATARAGGMVEISVADTGPGLPESVRARLFEPFVTTKPNGMGIGLSVSRTIIEAHGGEIRAERGAGGGTVFRLTVPGRPPPALRARARDVAA